jgi:putative acetyltransferase
MIREERAGDEAAIFAVTQAAFANHPHSEGTEPYIVDRLRADGDMVLSLVYEGANGIVGHVAFSPTILSSGDEGWLTLGPISVLPEMQKTGIGGALIAEAKRRLARAGYRGIVLVGDPGYYGRHGFRQGTPITIDGPLATYLQTCSFDGHTPEATADFVPAFSEARAP